MSNDKCIPTPTSEIITCENLNIEVVKEEDEDDDVRIKRIAEEQKFLNMAHIDLHGLVALFDTYATKKTYATSFFNIALIATNFTQLKQLIGLSGTPGLGTINIVVMIFVCTSLIIQVVVGIALVFLAKKTEFIDAEKREQLIRSNDFVTLLVIAISIINVFINVFLNV